MVDTSIRDSTSRAWGRSDRRPRGADGGRGDGDADPEHNPAMVCPELELVHKVLPATTVTAARAVPDRDGGVADIVLPATMFLEHDDFYTASGHTSSGDKAVIEPRGECRENMGDLRAGQAPGAKHRGFDMTPWEI